MKSKSNTTQEHDPDERAIEKRWTKNLVVEGWTPVVDAFLKYYSSLPIEITNVEAIFIVHLMQFKWDKSAPYPAFKTLASRMGVSPNQARSYARSLEKKGYIRREMRTGQTNRFYFDGLFKALETQVDIKKSEKRMEEDEID